MSFCKKISKFLCRLLPIDPLKIVFIGREDRCTDLDKMVDQYLHSFNNQIKLCKIVNFSNEKEDYKRYPSSILLSGRNNQLALKDLATAKIIVDFELSASYPKHNRKQIIISIPGKEIFDENFVKQLKPSNFQYSLDFCIARDERYAEQLQKIFANRVQILKYGDPAYAVVLNKGQNKGIKEVDRFIKLLMLILTSRDPKYYDLFRRLNIKRTRYITIGIWHSYFGVFDLFINRLMRKYINIRLLSPFKNRYREFYKNIFYYLPVKNNRVVLRNFQNKYGDNPKYITEELLKRNKNYDIVWIVDLNKSNRESYPVNVRVVPNNSFKSWYNLYTAKVWVDNNVRIVNPIKKAKQFYIQTWHGSLGIKKFDNVWAPEVVLENNRITDVCISNSLFETNVYKTTVWPDVKVEELGHPRNDIFFWNDEKKNEVKQKIFSLLDLPSDAKIILYAPTFRDDHLYGSKEKKADLSMYLNDYNSVLTAVTQKFGGNWFILERLHYHVKSRLDKQENNSHVIDVSDYNDMQELMVISDIGITDYSSWIYDFALTYKPGFILAIDEKQYLEQRELYFSLRSTPFPFAANNNDLVTNIHTFNEDTFRVNMDQFLQDKGCIEAGNASSRVVDIIDQVINRA